MRVNLMIEGQEDVTWSDWTALADACEAHGLDGLFRSDHYVSVFGRTERGSLDAWATLAALAARTSRIRLGTMVSPATFRHPSVLAKMVATVDHISSGRAELGLGAGWHEPEHAAYGFPFPPTRKRVDALAEQLEIVARQWSEEQFSFTGEHYQLRDVRALPHPLQQPRPTLIVGGSGGPRSIALAGRWADEYNTVAPTLEQCRQRRGAFTDALAAAGRDPADARFSVMTGCVIGHDDGEVRERAARVLATTGQDSDPSAYLEENAGTAVVGTVEQVIERLRALGEAGVDRIMLQVLDHTDLDAVELIGREVVPAVADG